MKAEIQPSYDKKRQKLLDIIPLEAPLGMYIEPTRRCNFKCFYCMHATRGVAGGQLDREGFRIENMSGELYTKIIKDIMAFPQPPKRIAFSGLGEPLMNKDLPNMIKELRDAGFTGRIDVLTNGVLLTPKMADALVAAGISRIQISIQAVNKEGYQENSGVDIDFKALLDNISYLYKHKGNASVFIKIIDSLLKNKNDEKKFYELFGNLCDAIYIEHLVVMQKQMGDHQGMVDFTRNLNNELVAPRKICSIMFYFLQVNIDGQTFPCSTPGLPNGFSMGCAKEKSLLEIWNDRPRNELICKNLREGRMSIEECRECSSCICIADPAEDLDDHIDEALKKFKK